METEYRRRRHPVEPYIGLRGFRRTEEAESLLFESRELKVTPLMVGVIVTPQTLFARIGPEWPHQFIQPEAIAKVFPAVRTLNLVHVVAPDSTELYPTLVNAYTTGGPHCHGVQVNIPWPEQAALNEFRARCPEAVIAVEVGEQARKMADNLPGMVGGRFFANYAGVADYAVLSMRTNEPFVGDIYVAATPYLRDICSRRGGAGWQCRPVFSSDFEPEDANNLDILFLEFPDLSVDWGYAALRPDRFLDLPRALRFIEAVGTQMPLQGDPTPTLR